MSKKKTRLYITAEKKKDNNILRIDPADIRKKARNMLFVNMMRTCKSNIVESKKYKPNKYPHKYDYED